MKPLIKDGAMGSWLRAQGFTGWLEVLNLTHPDAILAVHEAYLAAGAEALTTNSFCATLDLQTEAETLAYTAASLARKQAGQRPVLGSVGPGARSPQRGDVTVAQLSEDYRAPIRGLIEGQVDILWLETSIDVLQLQAAVSACHKECTQAGVTLPIWGLLALRDAHHLVGGMSLVEAVIQLRSLGLSGVGINCTDPVLLLPAFETLQTLELPLACIPNAGTPVAGHYGITREAFTQVIHSLHSQFALTWVGGCCGTTPQYIQCLSQLLGEEDCYFRE